MDLELTDEQAWASEAVETMLGRSWPPPERLDTVGDAERTKVWSELTKFGALGIGGPDGMGMIELSLIAKALGAHLASVPFLGSAAARYALAPLAEGLPAAFERELAGDHALALALLGPRCRWSDPGCGTTITEAGDGRLALAGCAVGVEHLDSADALLVACRLEGEPGLALVETSGTSGTAIIGEPQRCFDHSLPMHRVVLDGVVVDHEHVLLGDDAREAIGRLMACGRLLAAAESVGAAARIAALACEYASQRRQFGRPIGTFQALRHVLSDIYVGHASCWSTVLYASAALDGDVPDAERTSAIAKAYVSRRARGVAHGAIQAFGGVAITAEHPAHRFLRRIVVRERQFGDAAFHEAAIGRALAGDARAESTLMTPS